MENSFESAMQSEQIMSDLVYGMAAFVVIIGLICLIFGILVIVGQWKCFKKAGKEGWTALIPFYNTVVMCEIVGITPWWVAIVFGASLILNVIPIIGSLISIVISIYFSVILNISMAKSFGKSAGFGFGLMFLPPVFYLLLAKSDVQYVGQIHENDFLTNYIEKKNQTNNTNNNSTMNNQSYSYCSSCGTQVTSDTAYCPKCGNKLK